MKILQPLQKLSPKFSSPLAKLEYDKAQQDFALSFFKIILAQIFVGNTYIIILYSIKGQFKFVVPFLISITLIPIIWKFSAKCKKYINYAISVIFILFCINAFLALKGTFISPESYIVFFLGYGFGTYERIFTLQIPSFNAKIGFSFLSFLTRGVVFYGVSDTTVWVMQALMVLLGVFVDVFKENHEKKRFQKCYDYRESLTKFKDLMVRGLPSRLLILSRDLKQEFFSNEPLQAMRKSILRKKSNIEMLHEWLGHLVIDNKTFSKTVQDSLQLDDRTVNLMEFLQDFVRKEHCIEDKKQRVTFTAEYDDPVTRVKKIFEIHFFAMIWGSKESIALIINDVTERSINLNLKLADANKDKMLAMISHELRTPLNGILGVVNILEKQTKEPTTIQYLALCRNNGELLLNLVNSILDLQHIRDNKFSLKITRYDLHDLLKGVIQLFKFQFEEKKVELLLEVHQDVPQYIVSDQDRLRQILINLLGNAFKFTFEGQVVVSVGLEKEKGEGYLEFKILDTGIGIKEEDKKKLFKMYGRLEQEDPKTNTQGIGFGLEISNQLAKLLAHNDFEDGIKVESEYGEGSAFSFIIKDLQVNHDHSLKDQELAFDEPHVFAEEIENISIKMSPYNNFASTPLLGSEKDISLKSTLLKNMPSKFSSTHNLTPKRNSDRYINMSPMSRPQHNNHKLGMIALSNSQKIIPNLVAYGSSSPAHTPINTEEFRSEISFLTPTGDFSLQKSGNLPFEKNRALIVDDNPFNLLVAKHLLEGLHFTVETALNGKLGVDLAKTAHVTQKKPFILVLMDLQMPVMDGYEATKVLREMIVEGEIPDLHIIAVSANDSEDDKRRCKEVGMNDHLAKPLNEKHLKEALDRIFSGSSEDISDDDDDEGFDKVD